MFSKFLNYTMIMALIGLAACTKVGEQPPEQKQLQLSATKCFNKSATDLRQFFDASLDDARLTAAWSCIGTAFVQFQKYVVGKNQDRYTSQEIVTFLEDNFFEDKNSNKITPELQVELMKLKQIFIGGDTQFITRAELKRSASFIEAVSRITVKLNPYMKIIAMKWAPQVDNVKSQDLDDFEKANTALQEGATELATLILRNHSLYKIDDIVTLFSEFEKFYSTKWAWLQDIEKLIPGVKKLKKTLAGGDENTVNEKEWHPVLVLGARGYFQYLRYRYFIETTYQTGGAVRLVYVARTLEDVFSIFQELVSQNEVGVVTAHDIYDILHAFQSFWTDMQVSEKLVTDFMKVKQAIIGGSVDSWTVSDFEQARLKVPELRRIIENFMPYFNVYASAWDPNLEDPGKASQIFEESRVRLISVAHELAGFLASSYSYDDLCELVNDLQAIHPSWIPDSIQEATGNPNSGIKKFADSITQYRDVFVSVKKMLYGQNDTVVSKEQWSQVLPLVAEVYSLYQYYGYFIQDKSFRQSDTVKSSAGLVDNATNFAKNLLSTSTKGYFTQDEVVDLTIKITSTDLFKSGLQPQTAQNIWTALLQNLLFDPQRRLNGEKNSRLTMDQFNILKSEFYIWEKTQLALNDMFNNDPSLGYSHLELMKHVKDLALTPVLDPDLKTGLDALYSYLDSTVTSTLNSEDELEISNRVDWKYHMNALFQANLTRALTRMLMRSFSMSPNLNRVNKCEAQAAFDLIAGVFRDLKIFDPKDTFISSRFLDANIFTGRGNGDKYLDSDELYDLINVIFSGLRVNKKLVASLRGVCPIYKTPEGKEFVTFQCLSEHHYVMVRKYMTQLPDYKAYVDKLASTDKAQSAITMRLMSEDLTNEETDDATDVPAPTAGSRPGFATWNTVFRQTMKATGWDTNNGYGSVKEESVMLDDALYFPFIVHYMELIYSRWDSSKNGYLQAFEGKKAFALTFAPLLQDLAADDLKKGTIKQDDLLAVFMFLLRYKQEPGMLPPSVLIKWLLWRHNPSKWDREVYVGRTDIAQILGFIADKTRASNSDSSKPPVCPAD